MELTKSDKYLLPLLLLAQLIFSIDGHMILSLCVLDDLRGAEIDPVVQVAEEKEVVELVCQVKLV